MNQENRKAGEGTGWGMLGKPCWPAKIQAILEAPAPAGWAQNYLGYWSDAGPAGLNQRQYQPGANPQYDLWLANAMVALTEEELNARHLQLAAGMQNAGAVSFGISPYWPPERPTLRERIASAWREWLEAVDYWP